MSRWSPHPVTLRQLQYVLAVAEFRSFRRAAEACAVAQPSLSAQVAQLEGALGLPIFERAARGVAVTKAGEALLERARRTLLDADDLLATAERSRDPLSGTLHIGVIPTVAPYLLPEISTDLRQKFPRLRLLWAEEKTRVLVERIAAGELDAGILAVESEIGDLEYAPLGRDAFYLAVPGDHRLARSTQAVKVDQLADETVLLLEDGHCFRDQALDVCRRGGAEEASVRATSLSTLTQMVAGGMGITFLPQIAIRTENRARSLVTRPFGARGPARTLALAWRKTAPFADTLQPLAGAIRSIVSRVASAKLAP
ncbi:MAG: LysR substrate-binding domain-containing protein [Myxococcales bacterium]